MSKLQRLRNNIAALTHAFGNYKEYDNSVLGKYTGFGGLGFILNPLDTGAWVQNDLDCFVDTMKLQQLLINNSATEKEYKAWMQSLKASTLTAFYTPELLVKSISKSLTFADLDIDSMLDPASGVGAFLQIGSAADNVVAYEKDMLTGLLLKRMYRKVNVRVNGFESIPTTDLGMFDMVATNVPFGDIKVYDPVYSDSKSNVRRDAAKMIHRYYVLKGLDCLHNGGLLVYIITSNYLNRDIDQLREVLKQSTLIGAYRLANNLFKANGTEVGTDLLVLQKNEDRVELTDDECMLLTPSIEQGCPTNMYFTLHTDHVIATERKAGTDAYGKAGFVYLHRDGVKGIAKELGKIFGNDLKLNINKSSFNDNKKTTITVALKHEKQLTAQETMLKSMHDVYVKLYEDEYKNMREEKDTRTALNTLYDLYVKEYGYLRSSNTINIAKRMQIMDVIALENTDEDGNNVKADILLKPIAFSTEESDESMTARAALAKSLNEYGEPNLSYMMALCGMTQDDLLDELNNDIYFNPITDSYEIAAKFISGNVIEKIETINNRYPNTTDKQVIHSLKALQDNIPTPIPFEDLDFNLGERWVDDDVYARFASDFFSLPENPNGRADVTVKYSSLTDLYAVSCFNRNEKIYSQYAVHSEASNTLDGMDLLTHALHDTTPKMMRYKHDAQGHIMYDDNNKKMKEEDANATQLANAKIEEIRLGYVDWLQKQPKEFRIGLADEYNHRFNCFVKPCYDGSHQTFPGLNMAGLKEKYGIEQIYNSQKDCVWMLLLNGGGICDHEVGTGKTLIMCIAAHEMKRLGLVHKPMIIGLKANVSAIAETYQTAYPEAKILFAKGADNTGSKRQDFFNRIKNNDWDCVIMSHDQFSRIPQSERMQQTILENELQQIEDALDVLNDLGYTISRKMRKGLEQRKRNTDAKLRKVLSSISKNSDDVCDFEVMGIDHIFIDESHQFKNLGFTTRHDRVAGLGNTEGSKRAFNMLMAIRTIQERTGRDLGATFLSGTTVTNSLTELYCLFRYLRPQALKKQGINCFDAWAAIFTKKTSEFEFGITNTIQMKERFRYFLKVPELAMFYNEITDYRTAKDVGIERPEMNVRFISIKPTPDQEKFIETLMQFAKTGDFSLIGMDCVSDKQRFAKMLYATDLARKMSLDMRLIDPMYGDHPNNKASRCAELIKEYYDRYNSVKGTQMVFSDLSTWQGTNGPWNVYGEIKRKLISEYGIPATEIRFIQEAKSDRAKQALIKEVNEGKVRVLFGSTSMLGTGVNAQERIVALHHLDCPWRPSDLEQRNGRGVRKGNEIAKLYADNKVDVIIYAVERSLDSYKFNLLHCKQTFISQLKRGQLSIRTLDEGVMDENTGMNFSEYMAVLSGNTDLLDRAKLERKIATMESERKNFNNDRREQEEKQTMLQNDSERLKRNICVARKDIVRYNKVRSFDADGQVVNTIMLNGFTPDANLTADERLNAVGKQFVDMIKGTRTNGSYKEIGSIYGFPILMKTVESCSIDGKPMFDNLVYVKGELMYNRNNGKVSKVSYRLAAEYPLQVMEYIKEMVSKWEAHLSDNSSRIGQLSAILSNTWGKEAQLAKLRADLKQLDAKISAEINESKTAERQPQDELAKAA